MCKYCEAPGETILTTHITYSGMDRHRELIREAPPQKKRVHLGIAQKGGGGGVETLAQIVCGSSSVNINHY